MRPHPWTGALTVALGGTTIGLTREVKHSGYFDGVAEYTLITWLLSGALSLNRLRTQCNLFILAKLGTKNLRPALSPFDYLEEDRASTFVNLGYYAFSL